MLLGTLGASLLGNLLTGKGTITVGEGSSETIQGQGTIRASEDFYYRLILYLILKTKVLSK